MDKNKHTIHLNLINRSTEQNPQLIELDDSNDEDDDIIFLDKNEIVIPLEKKIDFTNCELNSNSDVENKNDQQTADIESNKVIKETNQTIETELNELIKETNQLINNKSNEVIKELNQLIDNKSNEVMQEQNQSINIESNEIVKQTNKSIDNQLIEQTSENIVKSNHLNNQINESESIDPNEDESNSSDMSISSEETSSISNVSKNFPEFFNPIKQQFKIDESKQSIEEPKNDPIDNSEQIPFLENSNQIGRSIDENDNQIQNLNSLSNFKESLYEYDKDDEMEDMESIEESIDNLEPSIVDTLPYPSQFLFQTTGQLDNDDFITFLKHVDPGQFSQEDDKRLFDALSENYTTSSDNEIQVIKELGTFELCKTTLNSVLNKISKDNNLKIEVITNIIEHHLNGESQSFISRYSQHFDFKMNQSFVTKIINDFNYLANVSKLKNLKRLVLDKKNRFDDFGLRLLDQCTSYENIALIFYLYYENTQSDMFIDDELSSNILNKKQLDYEIGDFKDPSNKQLNESMIRTVGHYLSINAVLIEFLTKLDKRPTFTVKLNENQSSNIINKFKKWENQRIKIEEQSPVDMLRLIYAEESQQIELEFDFSTIEAKAYDLLLTEYFLVDAELLKIFFDYMWSYYFKNQLSCYYRYETKVRCKKLIKEDFQLMVKSMLLKEPANNRTILCIEPLGHVFEEGLQYGIRKNNCIVLNSYFDLSKGSFNKFFVSLYQEHKFTNIVFANNYFSHKLRNMISDCLKSDLIDVRNQISITVLPKDNTLVETVGPVDKVNYYIERFSDPLRHFISFREHMIITDCEYFDLMSPNFDEILNDLFYKCVAFLAVDVNIEDSKLKYVNGLNEQLSQSIIEYRKKNGSFYNRLQLKRVPGITDEVFRECAGFLSINRKTIQNFNEMDAPLLNIFDSTIIHPNMYDDAELILNQLRIQKSKLGTDDVIRNCRGRLATNGIAQFAEFFQEEHRIDPITTKIVFDALISPLNFDYRISS